MSGIKLVKFGGFREGMEGLSIIVEWYQEI
jgi:hypothetical protein